jgi:hypothetical protein
MTSNKTKRILASLKPGTRSYVTAFACAALLVGACGGDDPISISAPVGISLKAEAGDFENNVITVEKGINTESGNPWGAFVTDVDAQLGGPPSDIEIASLDLLLAASSEGFTELRGVFDGTVDVQFEMNDTGNVFPAGSAVIDASTEGRTVALQTTFDYRAVQGADLDKLLAGSFKVVMSGPAATGFEAIDGKAELQLTFAFAAFE